MLNVTEAEANEILRTFDPISTMAQPHKAQLEVLPALLEHRKTRSPTQWIPYS